MADTAQAAPGTGNGDAPRFAMQLGRMGPAIGIHLALLALWYAVTAWGGIPRFILPSPVETVSTLFQPHYNWGMHIYITTIEVFGGFILASIFGVALAVVFSWWPVTGRTAMPLLVTLNMIPKVAMAPLLIVWLSYGVVPNIVIAFTICVFPIVITTARGLREVEADLVDLVRALRGSRQQIFTKIQLPSALPYIFSGMRVAAVLAVAGAVVGEFIGSERGLGYLMLQVQSSLDTPAMFMCLGLISMIGIVLYGLVVLGERLFVVADARLD
ncbi:MULTISPECIES: ABC transporter permease [unclassified Chelatococcus]|uniref:ABC transporter permease n=1 Tax=unclassified Chelatococcus TaxID=2638111 RepID=UPI0020BE6C45|nr:MULTISPECIES: ABC transporter permease [unclassified Chelatococcus]MCO5076469.1 ABC transporter permease [Chelatococcus sp.]CAH1672038.1 NitT/TauT family transport system permease protein [Hyphomicrobiales bacterium]CAH1675742.1 NitT/TauT family transport system permease protein [Hyphomicrobiales bacterium]